MVFKRGNTEIETVDAIEAAVLKAAGYEVIDEAGELNDKTLDDISDRDLKSLAARFSVPDHGMLSDPAELRELIAQYMG